MSSSAVFSSVMATGVSNGFVRSQGGTLASIRGLRIDGRGGVDCALDWSVVAAVDTRGELRVAVVGWATAAAARKDRSCEAENDRGDPA